MAEEDPTAAATDLVHLRAAIACARLARDRGNEPFGAVLATAGQVLLAAENTQIVDRDCTAHAEMNLVRVASRRFDAATLAAATLYASCEPCPMCAGAIYWSGIGRLVFALSHAGFRQMMGKAPDERFLGCREILGRNRRQVTVIGPLLEGEAREPHRDYWATRIAGTPAGR